jgi:hypothetical protein
MPPKGECGLVPANATRVDSTSPCGPEGAPAEEVEGRRVVGESVPKR